MFVDPYDPKTRKQIYAEKLVALERQLEKAFDTWDKLTELAQGWKTNPTAQLSDVPDELVSILNGVTPKLFKSNSLCEFDKQVPFSPTCKFAAFCAARDAEFTVNHICRRINFYGG